MTSFSAETLQVLEASGWREDRHVDTSEFERILMTAGYDDCQAACAFLKRYGDLEVDTGVGENWLDTRLSPILEIMKQVPVSHFSDVVGRALYFIGSCEYDFSSLLMDSSGRVYRHMNYIKSDVFGTDLFLIAASGEEAMEKIVQEDQTGVNIRGEWVANSYGLDYLQGGLQADRTIGADGTVNPNKS